MREIRTLPARWRGLETGLRFTLHGHEGGNSRHGQGRSLRTTAPVLDPTSRLNPLSRLQQAGDTSFKQLVGQVSTLGDVIDDVEAVEGVGGVGAGQKGQHQRRQHQQHG